MRNAALVLASLVFLLGCRGLSREFNQSLPDFLRADPGKEEMQIFAKVRQAREWSEEDLSRQKDLFDEIETDYREGRFETAGDLLEDYLEQYPGSQYDERARFLLGNARFKEDAFEKSFSAFKDFSALYPVSDLGAEVVELEYVMGKDFLDGLRSTFFGIFSNASIGEKIMEHIVENYPSSARASDAQWALARYHMRDEDWPKAQAAFRFVATQYPTSEWYTPALFYAAYCQYRQVKGAPYDPTTMRGTREGFELFLRESEGSPWRNDAKEIVLEMESLEAEHILVIAEWYVGQGREFSARFYFMKVVTLYPQTSAAERAKAALAAFAPEALPSEAVPAPEPSPEPAR